MPTPEETQTCINALTTGSTKENFAILAGQAIEANTGVSFSVATVSDLPDLSTTNIGDGQIVFVESINVPVMSLGVEWVGLDSRVLRRDDDYTEMFLWGAFQCGLLLEGSYIQRQLSSPVREFTRGLSWCAVSVGRFGGSALKTDSTLWSWGRNTDGESADGTTGGLKFSPVQEICSATNWCNVGHSLIGGRTAAVKTDGTLWGWGAGPVGDGTATNRCSPVREFCSATNWRLVSSGDSTSAIKTDGTLWSWGNGACGRLATGNVLTSNSPVQEITSSTNWINVKLFRFGGSAVKSNGTLWSWGNNCLGTLGNGNVVNVSSPVQEFCSATNWCVVSAGDRSMSAIKTDGTLWSWGRSPNLGNGTLVDSCSPVQEFCSATNWCALVSMTVSTSAIKTDGTLWSWGAGVNATIGDGFVTDRCSPVQEFSSSTNWRFITNSGYCAMAAIKQSLQPL
jgi:alpha-tubulin suppressor-like RCC1 family protein